VGSRRARGYLAHALLALAALSSCERGSAPGSSQAGPSAGPAASTQAATATPEASHAPQEATALTTDAICERFANAPIPEAELPHDAPGAAAGCDAEALYYGIDAPADYAAARRCAYRELDVDGAPPIGGPEVLMMIYANGRGVPQNLDLALRFACRAFGAPAELAARVGRLWQARSSTAPKWPRPFDVCDDVTSGYMSGHCAAHDERIAAVARRARKRRIALGMPASFAAVDRAAGLFFETRAGREVDLSGTQRGRISIEERAKLEDDFLELLERLGDRAFEPEQLPAPALEKQLAEQLSRLASCKNLAELERLVPGAVTRAGIFATQSSWRAYRAAFVHLARELRPTTPESAWSAWLAQKRLAQLRELADGC
jgi:hypothetical protein